MPVTHVQSARQRNQKSARGISSGTTTFFVPPSMVAAKGPFTKLKKYRCPIQTMPATTWIQRKSAWSVSVVSIVGLLSDQGSAAVLARCELSSEMPDRQFPGGRAHDAP